MNDQQALDIQSTIIKDWDGGYKIELDLAAKSEIPNWQADFYLPYQIDEVYGANLIDRGEGNYTISGESGEENLSQGQVVDSAFIVADNGGEAIAPEFTSNSSPTAETTDSPEQGVGDEDSDTTSIEDTDDSDIAEADDEESTIEDTNDSDIPEADEEKSTINVDEDFDGDLAGAIAAANDGDTVQLGSNTYAANGITIDKNITLDGQDGSVINGGGTSGAVVNLNSAASGATIQDIEITNGNNGIYSEGAYDLTLQNLEVNSIGIEETIRDAQNNTGIILDRANGLELSNTEIDQVGRKGVGINDTDGALISGLTVRDINLAAQHSQNYDAAGIKFFNTNDVTLKNSDFSDINAFHVWNDTTNGTTIDNNTVRNAGEDFSAPDFTDDVDVAGIYNEKSSNSVVRNNDANSVGGFSAFRATAFSTETMILENNNFSSLELDTTDFWVNESAEKAIATTEDPAAADFSLIADEFFAQTNIG